MKRMKIGAIVQARMSSQRLPGKVLHRVGGKPMLQYLLERLEHCRSLDRMVVATSTDESDDPIAAFCEAYGVDCFRGSLTDVAGRFKAVLDRYPFEGFVRVNGDSPLFDQSLVDRGVDIFRRGNHEIVTNLWPRTFPSGQTVEILKAETFRLGYSQMQEPEDLEHITQFFYKNADRFRICNFTAVADYNGLHLSIDTERDMKAFAEAVSNMVGPHWQYGLAEVVRLYDRVA